MCLILFAHNAHPGYRLVLASNRDEFFARPTAPADYWQDAPSILGGRDLEKGGTWMGVTRDGRWAAVTNYRDGTPPGVDMRSRGELVARYLAGNQPARQYADGVTHNGPNYHGFNLLLGDEAGLVYVSNRQKNLIELQPGIFGLSNHLLDTSWPKVERGKQAMATALEESRNAGELEIRLLSLLSDRRTAGDDQLPATGVSAEWEKRLSAAFIEAPGYGTRACSVLMVGVDGEVRFRERSFAADGVSETDRMFRFSITPQATENRAVQKRFDIAI